MLYKFIFKRFFDIVFSICFIIFLLPLFLLISIFIKILSTGPVFFLQNRMMEKNKEFKIIKFRTMHLNSDKIGTFYTQYQDPRIYSFGGFLRRWSLDELPQLFNVLKGDMSFIGPRPVLKIQKKFYTMKQWNKINSIKPGITGLSQVMGRSSLSENETKKFDLLYVKKLSMKMDFIIFLKTLITLFKKRGVN